MFKNRFSLFVATFLIIGFFFLALPEEGYSGLPTSPGGPPCCDVIEQGTCVGGDPNAMTACGSQACSEGECSFLKNEICVEGGQGSGRCEQPTGCCQLFAPDGPDECFGTNDIPECEAKKGEFIPGGVCSTNGIECIGPQVSPIPTLSQWGLIAMAGILGIIGFIMVIRRRKVSA